MLAPPKTFSLQSSYMIKSAQHLLLQYYSDNKIAN